MNKCIAITLLFFLVDFACFGQSHSIQKADLMRDLIAFLSAQGEIDDTKLDDYYSGKREVEIIGVMNGMRGDQLKNGIYSFFVSRSHHRTFLLIIENEKSTILDIVDLDGVKRSLGDLLEFCERNKYCVEITNSYAQRLLNIYHTINKNPHTRTDQNCKNGVSDVKQLP